MDYNDAAKIKPGDVITFDQGDGERSATVTGEVHPFFSWGHVVYVPIAGAMIVNTHIRSVSRG